MTQLTPGESLWLWRRRKGWTQQQAAAHCRVCFDTIARAEYDIGGNVVFELLENNLKSILPTLPEALRLARRRTALLQGVGNQQVATDAGVSRPTLLAAERAAAPWLIDYWHSLGFRFPIK